MVVEFPWFEHRSFSFFSVFLFFIVFSAIVLLTCILMYYKNLAECVKSRNSEKYMLKESSWVRYHLALVVVSLISQHWSRVLLLLDVPTLLTLPQPLGIIPYLHCSSIHKPTQQIPSHDLWKGRTFQVAYKCIDTTFIVNIL